MVTNSMMIQEAYCSFFSVRKESWVRSVHRATVLTHDISAGVKSTVTHHCTFTAICVCVCGWLGVCMCGCVWVGLGVCDVSIEAETVYAVLSRSSSSYRT